LQKANFFARASRWQVARFSIAIRSAAAISPGLLGLDEDTGTVAIKNSALQAKTPRSLTTKTAP